MFSIFISDLDSEMKCTLFTSLGDTKINVLKGCDVMQMGLDKLVPDKPPEVHKAICKVLHLGGTMSIINPGWGKM